MAKKANKKIRGLYVVQYLLSLGPGAWKITIEDVEKWLKKKKKKGN